MREALFMTCLVLTMSLSGCFGSEESSTDGDEETLYPDIYSRHTLDWNWSDSYSYVLEPGPYTALDVQEAFIEVDTSDIWETGPPTSNVHLSYWLPSNTQEGEQVPVIAVISPYFSYGQPGDESGATNVVGAGRGEFIFDNYIPHGYAFAQVSVFGTEESSGCFDYRGAGEGLGIHSAVEWLGSQNWSNGKVGLYGKSYEGATQWEAAALGSEYLATIVPISGTTGLHPLLYKNGSAEARSQVMHMNYFSSTVDYNADDLDNICPDIIEGFFAGPVTYGLGELDPYMENYYDEREHISKALTNYNGSIYWVQGMQDWNVDPHQVFGGPPGTVWYQDFIEAGFDVRGMLGQWEHNYPDQWTKHNAQDSGYGGEAIQNMTRWDWGQDLFEWFEYYLKGIGEKPEAHAQIQRNDGQWRIEESWPPTDSEIFSLELSDCQNDGAFIGGGAPVVGGGQSVTVECPGINEEDLHISGLATIHIPTVPTFDGGQVFVELQDAQTGLRLGHATMDVRYHAGGSEPQTAIPGQTITMLMEFQGMDVILPAGNGLRFVITDTGEDYLAPACGTACVVHVLPSMSTFEAPIIDRTNSEVLITPQSEEAANNQ
ncbi:MAG: CocE/NonD family hydrolase [Candidatus Poseidoniaceae archaeon]|nr:CocE/NonD family hydrolase [Candidatus Poseidoniaceae archaeon]|tara:strand:+ start:4911 stop:6713 length:1803 start_codon:yes stop_codon:yes gene_type:complete